MTEIGKIVEHTFSEAYARADPYMERSVASLHHKLSRYMGTGVPTRIK